jgi:VWFA-related protein
MTTGSGRVLVVVATAVTLIAGGGPPLSAQQAATPPPAFRSGIEVVTVDVGVVDRRGQPLRGLTPADFVVSVGGQPRKVVTAEYIDRSAPRPALPPSPDGALLSTNEGGGVGRLFVFIVDQNTLDLGSARRVATATAPFLSRLTFADRSALMIMPLGPNVPFTWAHDRVLSGLQRVTGSGRAMASGWDYGSLADARDIANRNLIALRTVGERECGNASASGFGAGAQGPSQGTSGPSPVPGSPTGGGAGGGGETGTPAGGPAPGAAPAAGGGGGAPTQRGSGFGNSLGQSSCSREIQMQAEATWRSAQMNSLASISALRQFIELLGRVRGDKTVILISGGWPLDERDEHSTIFNLAAEASAARATVHSVFVPTSSFSADRRVVTSTPLADNYIHSGPLETLAAMTGGGSYRAEVGAEGVFERLGVEMSGYYRIGIAKDPSDNDGKGRRMKVQVPSANALVRAREIFDVRTYEDRDWAARLATAIEGPVPATDIGVRVTSYLSADPEDSTRRRLLVSGEVSRAQPGDATLQVLVSNLEGKRVTAGELSLAHASGDTLPFSTNVSVPPGSYIVRVGVMDGGGRVGSVDHRVDVRDVTLGTLTATGPVLVRVPQASEGNARLALEGARQDERLALEVDLEGEPASFEGVAVDFEIAASNDGPNLLHAPAAVSRGSRENTLLAQGVADMRMLPPGTYIARARITSPSGPVGNLSRSFSVMAAPRLLAETSDGTSATISAGRSVRSTVRPTVAAPAFTLDQVLAPNVLAAFLDRVAARPDAASPGVRDLLARARTGGLEGLTVTDAQAAVPVGAFLKGLTLLADSKLDPAANAFRDAMRGSIDFPPAMVYLGACFAAAGKDKEAASVWQTALIREGDTPALHVMLADALLRQGRADVALQDLDAARTRWPDDLGLKRRFAVAAMVGGKPAEGLSVLDELLAARADDEPSLAFALLALYEAFESGRPIDTVDGDRARMVRLADAYRVRGGPSLALVDTWMAAATKK